MEINDLGLFSKVSLKSLTKVVEPSLIAGKVAIDSIKQNDFSDNFLATYKKKCDDYLGEYFDVAIDLLKIPTNDYWETLIDSMELFKEKNPNLILKYLKTEMNYNDAKKIFPTLKMNH